MHVTTVCHTHAHTHVCAHIYTHTHIHSHTHTHTHACALVYIQVIHVYVLHVHSITALNSQIRVADRPVTQQGLAGMRTGSKGTVQKRINLRINQNYHVLCNSLF